MNLLSVPLKKSYSITQLLNYSVTQLLSFIFINKQVDIYRQASLRICNPLSKNVRPLKPGICNPHVFRHLGSTDLRHLRNQLIDLSLSFCKFFCDICFSFYDIICLFYDIFYDIICLFYDMK